ncbi:hypothetical protein CDL15_Pgr008537 [Punica granatum]|uniref:Alpha/beta hydrolase fold-3 domain-containing protein n=1 Tax=Punica granatum TaxID=22663 RepID=A0A218WN09_PUNGR|nr:hypothetical protein CDL15_Pgr008537 [Punica granatum]
MGSISNEVQTECLPFFRIYKDGTVERLIGTPYVPPSLDDPKSGVSSKDITISQNPLIKARLHIPKQVLDQSQATDNKSPEKLPLLVYYHGGGFCIESAFSLVEHRLLQSITAEARILAVSIEYRLAPEHLLPAAYEDCWEGLQWVTSHSAAGEMKPGFEADPWITIHADFERLFIGGDSAGANLAYNTVMRAGTEKLSGGVKILGAFITHPYFWGSKAVGSENEKEQLKVLPCTLWNALYPNAPNGIDNPMINPLAPKAPSLSGLACKRLLVSVASQDQLKSRGVSFYKAMKESGWEGEAELVQVEGEEHAFHILNFETESAKMMIKRLAEFLRK